jgi:hypothetical protein
MLLLINLRFGSVCRATSHSRSRSRESHLLFLAVAGTVISFKFDGKDREQRKLVFCGSAWAKRL